MRECSKPHSHHVTLICQKAATAVTPTFCRDVWVLLAVISLLMVTANTFKKQVFLEAIRCHTDHLNLFLCIFFLITVIPKNPSSTDKCSSIMNTKMGRRRKATCLLALFCAAPEQCECGTCSHPQAGGIVSSPLSGSVFQGPDQGVSIKERK